MRTPSARNDERSHDRDENCHHDKGERERNRRLGDHTDFMTTINKGKLIRVQRVVDELETDEAENSGEAIVEEDDTIQQAVDEEVELT